MERWPLLEVRLHVAESPKVNRQTRVILSRRVIINLRDKRLISISLAMVETNKQSATKNLVFIRKKTGFVNLHVRLDLKRFVAYNSTTV